MNARSSFIQFTLSSVAGWVPWETDSETDSVCRRLFQGVLLGSTSVKGREGGRTGQRVKLGSGVVSVLREF